MGFLPRRAVLFSQLVEGDEESFNLALLDALTAHRDHHEVADRADDPDAAINLDILALACHARRRGWNIQVTSPTCHPVSFTRPNLAEAAFRGRPAVVLRRPAVVLRCLCGAPRSACGVPAAFRSRPVVSCGVLWCPLRRPVCRTRGRGPDRSAAPSPPPRLPPPSPRLRRDRQVSAPHRGHAVAIPGHAAPALVAFVAATRPPARGEHDPYAETISASRDDRAVDGGPVPQGLNLP
ncbi:immunity 49 family protein [Streptosporangium lutulentum]